jgi:hypothetical protein
MHKIIFLSVILSLLVGCSTIITVPVDATPLSDDESTLVIYHEQGINDEFKVYVDNQLQGTVTSEKPLKIKVNPGKHQLYADAGLIRQISNFTFEKGEVYFLKVWVDFGDRFVGSTKIEPSSKIEKYVVRSFKQ